ncbi:MAG TPA: acetyltransferase [Alphaproteobacteria bacterium]|nr:acetyltransferase [Alphaproteobacteria bacterium]
MPISLIILGVGGNSLSILDAVEEINRLSANGPVYDLRGFLDDLPENSGKTVLGYPVLGALADAHKHADCKFINGIASPESYKKKPDIVARIGIPRDRYETVIHPRAAISPHCKIGVGTAIMANSVICAEVEIGDHVIILQNTVVDHHSTIGDFATLSSGISLLGFTNIGRNAFIGGAAAVRSYITIGDNALVGMSSVVVKDVAADSIVAGNPARPFKPKVPM